MQNDIAALQWMYGADFTTNAGNTRYKFSPKTGEMFINGKGQGHYKSDHILLTIWDGGGNDTLDFSNYSTRTTIDISPGKFSTPDKGQRAEFFDGIFAKGCVAMSKLFFGDLRSVIENANAAAMPIGSPAMPSTTGSWAMTATTSSSAARAMILSSVVMADDRLVGEFGAIRCSAETGMTASSSASSMT